MHAQLGYSWTQITTTGGASLGACYQQLTGADPAQGFNDFVSQLATLDQGGQLSLPQNGNPFPIGGAVPPVPPAPGGTGAGGTPSGTPPGVPPMPSPATPMPNSPNSPLPVAGRPNWGYLIGLMMLLVLILLIGYLVTTHAFGL